MLGDLQFDEDIPANVTANVNIHCLAKINT